MARPQIVVACLTVLLAGCTLEMTDAFSSSLTGLPRSRTLSMDLSGVELIVYSRETRRLYERMEVDPTRVSLVRIGISPDLPDGWNVNGDESSVDTYFWTFRHCNRGGEMSRAGRVKSVDFFPRQELQPSRISSSTDSIGRPLPIPEYIMMPVEEIAVPVREEPNTFVAGFFHDTIPEPKSPLWEYDRQVTSQFYRLTDGEMMCVRLRRDRDYLFGKEEKFVFRASEY